MIFSYKIFGAHGRCESRTNFEQKFIMCSNFVLLLFKLYSNYVQIQILFTLCSSFWWKIGTLFPFHSNFVQIFWRSYWRGKVCSIFVHGWGQSISSKGLHSSIIQTVFIYKLFSIFVHTLFKFKYCSNCSRFIHMQIIFILCSFIIQIQTLFKLYSNTGM